MGIEVFIGAAATVAAAAGGGVGVMPGILRFANEPFPMLLSVANRDAVSTGGATIIIKSKSVHLLHSTFSNIIEVCKKKRAQFDLMFSISFI